MGDVSAEPSMEDILSSIKRIIAEDGSEPGGSRGRRPPRAGPMPDPAPRRAGAEDPAEMLELNDPAPAEPARMQSEHAILSDRAAEASRDRLAALSRLVVKPAEAGGDTLHGLVQEMLRPMLREWLDANLPELVEALVAREIARITAR